MSNKTKYLFEACFRDGTILHQTPDDESTTIPGKNAFYDVLQRIDEVMSFHLHGEGHTYSVFLENGHFEIDGVPFSPSDEQFERKEPFRLIRFLRTRERVNLSLEGLVLGGTSETDFIIGWQTNDTTGKNHKQVIVIQ